jgi:hypothetical protein
VHYLSNILKYTIHSNLFYIDIVYHHCYRRYFINFHYTSYNRYRWIGYCSCSNFYQRIYLTNLINFFVWFIFKNGFDVFSVNWSPIKNRDDSKCFIPCFSAAMLGISWFRKFSQLCRRARNRRVPEDTTQYVGNCEFFNPVIALSIYCIYSFSPS